MSPLRRRVSAAKNSVPGSRFGDWFDDCVGSMQFGPDSLHHPVLRNRKSLRRLRIGRFCGDFRGYRSALSVSGDPCGLSGRFLASRLCIQKFRSPRRGFDESRLDPDRRALHFLDTKSNQIQGVMVDIITEIRAASEASADSIRGLRTVGSIPREHRGVARHQCRGANDLRLLL
jgi:hypothetical protein